MFVFCLWVGSMTVQAKSRFDVTGQCEVSPKATIHITVDAESYDGFDIYRADDNGNYQYVNSVGLTQKVVQDEYDMNDDSVVVTDTNNTTNQLPEASTGFSYGPAILPQGYGIPLDKQALIQKGLEGEIIKYLQQRAKSQAEAESDPLKGQRNNMSYSNAINKASEAYIQRYR